MRFPLPMLAPRARTPPTRDSRGTARKTLLYDLARGDVLAAGKGARVRTEAHLADLDSRLAAFARRVRAETSVPGIVLGVSTAGRRFLACAGVANDGDAAALTSDARFTIGCAGKLTLALAALELEQRGALDTAAVLSSYLPELRGTLHGDSVRVSHLLAHTSGYRGTNVLDQETRAFTWEKLVAYLKVAPRAFAPGTVFSYEHTEAVLLGEVLERVTAQPAEDLVAAVVLAPLGVGVAGADSARAYVSAGRHRFDAQTGRFVALRAPALPRFWRTAFTDRTAAIGDLLSIGEAVIGVRSSAFASGGVSGGARRSLQRRVVRLPATIGGPLRELQPVAFGLGAAEFADGFHGMTGVSAGQCVGLRFDEASQTCVAVGLNAMLPYLRDFLLATVCRDLVARARAEPPAPFPFALDELVGTYLGPGDGIVDARLDAGRLTCAIRREGVAGEIGVEVALGDDERPVLRSPLPHVSLGFFREPGGEAALMLGLSAYKRGSTHRPFHR
jgi:CubicO group peptidase (beta-lactamase class C family)